MPHQVEREHLKTLLRPMLESGDGEDLIGKFDDHIRASATGSSARDFRELIFELVVDFLESDDPQAVRTAARIIRRNKGMYGGWSELDDIVETLTGIAGGRTITTATESALSLGFLLSTRPRDRDLPSWDGSDPLSRGGMRDLDQQQLVPETPDGPGYIADVDADLVDDAFDTLTENVDRKDYKRSTNWDVGEACTLAIGFIGYQSPERVEAAVPTLLEATTQDDTDFRAILYALSCIGYSRPDLLGGDVIQRIESLAESDLGDVPQGIRVQAQVANRKVGHAPAWLGKMGTFPDPNLEPIFEKLFRFMLGKFPSYPEEVSNAIVDIVDARPDDAIPLLAEELEAVVNGDTRTFSFPSNLMGILREVSKVRPTAMEPVAAQAVEIYGLQGMEHYWYDLGADLLENVYDADPSHVPSGLESTLRDFLEDERRASVQSSTQRLIDAIY